MGIGYAVFLMKGSPCTREFKTDKVINGEYIGLVIDIYTRKFCSHLTYTLRIGIYSIMIVKRIVTFTYTGCRRCSQGKMKVEI